ncbi:MAG: hypothetical protein KA319_03415 [Ferruginibacter sp.]|nr:hypothetical protein [Ferruginibacter sp.]
MKKIISLLFLLLFIASIGFAQDKNEIVDIKKKITKIEGEIKALKKAHQLKLQQADNETNLPTKIALSNEASQISNQINDKEAEVVRLKKLLEEKNKEVALQNSIISSGGLSGTILLSPEISELMNTWVDIYEFPNYQGRVVRVTSNTNNVSLPFVPDLISIKKGNGILKKIFMGVSNANAFELTNDISNYRVNKGGVIGIEFQNLPYIEVFEFPDFKGRSALFTQNIYLKENLDLPFIAKNISIRMSDPKMLVYLDFFGCNSGHSRANERITVLENGNVVIDDRKLCGLKIGEKMALRVKFNGVITDIHNDDCRRLYGKISYQIKEFDEYNREYVLCNFIDFKSRKPDVITVFDVPKNANNPISNYVYNIRNAYLQSLEGEPRGNTGRNKLFYSPRAENEPYEEFLVDKNAYIQKRIKIEVITNIGTHHKSCHTCFDYTADASMLNPITQYITITNYPNYDFNVQAGNFRHSSTGNFNGPAHSTFVDFTYSELLWNFRSN